MIIRKSKKMKTRYIFTIVFLCFVTSLYSQDDLLNILDNEVEAETVYTIATFKSTRIVNGHSIERMKKRQLDFRINHRFGKLNSGVYELFGLDNALINFSFDYGINDWLMVGIRRGTNKKTIDGSLKFSILRQSTGKVNMPVSVSYFVNTSVKTIRGFEDLPNMKDGDFTDYMHRMAFCHQLLVARKFSEKLSLQLSPSYVHRNYVKEAEKNDILALGIGGRYKFIRRVALTFEYFYTDNVTHENEYQYPLAFGFDIETGGHVFQIFATNSKPMVEDGFIGETTGNWLDGGIYFGFNISRVFAIKSKEDKKEK